ncbi:MAG: hypothetical protein ACPIOQ_20315 [Promethearchaeia archaeon]
MKEADKEECEMRRKEEEENKHRTVIRTGLSSGTRPCRTVV